MNRNILDIIEEFNNKNKIEDVDKAIKKYELEK